MDISFRSKVTEDLTTLYLRLNGYFTTGLILHAPGWGKLDTEIDCLAVRFPLSAQPERGIGADRFLEPSIMQIDLLFCEVKCRDEKLQFNKAIRKDLDRFVRALRWSGIFSKQEIERFAPKVLAAFTPKPAATGKIPVVSVNRRVRIRGLISSPERNSGNRRNTDPWYLGGDKIFDYAWRCFCPTAPRPTCSTRYDFTRWGHLEPIVRYFKMRGPRGAGTIKDLYRYLLNRHSRQILWNEDV